LAPSSGEALSGSAADCVFHDANRALELIGKELRMSLSARKSAIPATLIGSTSRNFATRSGEKLEKLGNAGANVVPFKAEKAISSDDGRSPARARSCL